MSEFKPVHIYNFPQGKVTVEGIQGLSIGKPQSSSNLSVEHLRARGYVGVYSEPNGDLETFWLRNSPKYYRLKMGKKYSPKAVKQMSNY
jgi:hypothetical protein